METATESKAEQEKELIERAEILFGHQKEQYETAVDGLRRLEDKATKTFASLSIIITATLLIVRYWWSDIFPAKYEPLHALCWLFLLFFIILVMISWAFTFSAMQLKDFEKPSSDPDGMECFFMNNHRYNSLTSYAKEYSRLTTMVDGYHLEKSKLVNKCFESMLYGSWAFVLFLICFLIIKFTA